MYRKKQTKTRKEQDDESQSHINDNHDYSEEKTIFIKEFDMNEMPPQSVDDRNGVKLVVVGKPGCFSPATKILMFDGKIKKVEDIIVGDVVMGDDGKTPRKVEVLYHDTDDMYEICNGRGGENYTVNRLHDLVLVASRNHGSIKKNDIIEISVEEYLKQNNAWKHTFKTFRSSGVQWEEKNVLIDPYFLGVWLGDVTSSKLEITNIDKEIIEYCKDYAEKCNLIFKSSSQNSVHRYTVISKEKTKGKNNILNAFNDYGLMNNKHIPDDYKINSEQVRYSILAGLLDTDGYHDKKGKCYEITQKNERLAKDIVFISKSLGISTTIRQVTKSCMYKGEKREGQYYKICMFGEKVCNIPVLLERKKIECQISQFKNRLHSSFKVIHKGKGEYYGFGLDGNRRFTLANFEIVKNTGKSNIISSIVDSKKHIIPISQIFSGTEDSNGFYCSKFPSISVFNSLKDLTPVENFIRRQKYAKRYLDNPWCVQIIDDCTDDPKLFTKPLFQSYYKNGRHWKMMHILSLQYCLDIKPVIRTNVDYAFILRESSKKNRKSLYENYASAVENQQEFETLMDALTTDYSSMVIVNYNTSNNIEDCIRWYKADLDRTKQFKFGCEDFWLFNNERLDTKYEDPVF